MLIVIAVEDGIISRPRSEALVAAFASGQARSAIVQGATHNTLDWSLEYLGVAQDFLVSQK